MSQEEVLRYLKNHSKEWFTAKELSQRMNKSNGSLNSNLSRLRKTNFIIFKRKLKNNKEREFEYKYKS